MAHPPLRGMGYMTGAGARRRKPTSVTECRDSLARWGRGARGARRPGLVTWAVLRPSYYHCTSSSESGWAPGLPAGLGPTR